MGLFRRKRSTIDVYFGRDDLRSAQQSLEQGDWSPAEAAIRSAPDPMLVMGVFVDTTSLETFRRWADSRRDALSASALGERLVREAWDIRGSGVAKTVGPDAWKPFFETLREAETVLTGAVEHGALAETWSSLIQASIGLQYGADETRRRFERAHELVPFHRSSTQRMLQASCQKWNGSHEQMFEFARWVTAHAPYGEWTIAVAHYERWVSMAEAGVASGTYFSQPAVNTEIVGAAGRFLERGPAGRAPIELLGPLNWLLFALVRGQQSPVGLARECVRRIDGRPNGGPWALMSGQGAKLFDQVVAAIG